MGQALGVIETCGMPSALITADGLSKAANVHVLGLENTNAGRISVVIRGQTGEVEIAIATVMQALKGKPGVVTLGYHVIPCPDDSVDLLNLRRSYHPVIEASSVEWLDD
ncbi:MAG: BMC domain-containing protein [Leptolyngbyaceae cyanobacterium]